MSKQDRSAVLGVFLALILNLIILIYIHDLMASASMSSRILHLDPPVGGAWRLLRDHSLLPGIRH